MICTRRTLAQPVSFSGITLFTGVQSAARVLPAEPGPGRGILFRRADLAGSPPIPALAASVVPESRRTVLSANPADKAAATVQTVEHIMSALAGAGITDAVVEVRGPEIPVMDGSAREFFEALAGAGTLELGAKRPVAVLGKAIRIERDGAVIEALPGQGPGTVFEYELDYGPGSPIRPQRATLRLPPDGPAPGYGVEVAAARTFCLLEEAQAMRKLGLFGHLGPREMLVVGPGGPVENEYRFPDEPARHKLLDLIGDIALCGKMVQGRIIARRSGHALNHLMAQALTAI